APHKGLAFGTSLAQWPSDLQLMRANMKRRIAVAGILATVLGLAGCGSSGRMEVESPPPVVRHETVREVIVVEHTHVPRGNAHGWWKNHGYREVTVYYDGARYYGRRIERPGIRAVIVWEREGKYYLGDEENERHGKHHDDDQGEDH